MEVTNDNKSEVMAKALEAYNLISEVGEKLAAMCMSEIQPLIDKGEIKAAKKAARDFFKESRTAQDGDYEGDIIFIEHDLIQANLNRMIKQECDPEQNGEEIFKGIDTVDLLNYVSNGDDSQVLHDEIARRGENIIYQRNNEVKPCREEGCWKRAAIDGYDGYCLVHYQQKIIE